MMWLALKRWVVKEQARLGEHLKIQLDDGRILVLE